MMYSWMSKIYYILQNNIIMFIIILVMQHCWVAYHHLYFLGTQISLHASVYIKNILIDLSPNRAIQGEWNYMMTQIMQET